MNDSEDAKILQEFFNELKVGGEMSEADLSELKSYIGVEDELPKELLAEQSTSQESAKQLMDENADVDATNIRFRLTDMTMAQKIKLAMFGNAACRTILVLDPNKVVALAALNNPKMKDGEIEEVSKNKNVSDAVLRAISGKGEWMRSYTLKLNLVMNPKTPQDISMKWIRFLQMADLKKIGRSKNIPQLIATTARKLISIKQKQ